MITHVVWEETTYADGIRIHHQAEDFAIVPCVGDHADLPHQGEYVTGLVAARRVGPKEATIWLSHARRELAPDAEA